MSNNPHQKYIKVNGISKINPEWKNWQNQNGVGTSLSKKEEDHALPVYCSQNEYLLSNPNASNLPNMGLSDSSQASWSIMQEDDVVSKVGLERDQILNAVGELFSRYEIPMGLMNKILEFQNFDFIFFMVDDSGSMNNRTDSVNPQTGQSLTRWEETRSRLVQLMEILAYIPTPTIIVAFLNRNIQLDLIHNQGEPPASFFATCCDKINSVFRERPAGTTPYSARIQQSFARFQGKKVAWYFFGDGVPDGGQMGIKQIESAVANRQNPQQNPVTFFSCTNEDSEVEWMKNLEEVAPFCSEFDDYQDEKGEVLLDQGLGLPYTKGFYMIGCLVSAMNPNDLDAMDESVPFTKYALDNLLGFTSDPQDYQHYFDLFVQAQRARKIEDKADHVKKNQDWRPMYPQFLECASCMEIQGVLHFKNQLLIASGRQPSGYASPTQGYPQQQGYAQGYAPPPSQGYAPPPQQGYAPPPPQGYAPQAYAPPPVQVPSSGPSPTSPNYQPPPPQFAGAKVYAPNSQGSTPTDYAKKKKKDCIIQ